MEIDFIDLVSDAAKMMKQVEPDEPFFPLVHLRRGGDELGVMRAQDRDTTLEAIAIAVPSFEVDELVFVTDAYSLHGSGAEKALLESLEPGELERRFGEGDPRVGEGLLANYVSRDGVAKARTDRYRVADGKVEWLDSEEAEGPGVQGFVIDCIRRAFVEPKFLDRMVDFGILSREAIDEIPDSEFHRDLAIVQFMNQRFGDRLMFRLAVTPEQEEHLKQRNRI